MFIFTFHESSNSLSAVYRFDSSRNAAQILNPLGEHPRFKFFEIINRDTLNTLLNEFDIWKYEKT
jgi:hypothetical protein